MALVNIQGLGPLGRAERACRIEGYEKKARYSLIVRLESESKDVEIDNAIAAEIESRVDTCTEI